MEHKFSQQLKLSCHGYDMLLVFFFFFFFARCEGPSTLTCPRTDPFEDGNHLFEALLPVGCRRELLPAQVDFTTKGDTELVRR